METEISEGQETLQRQGGCEILVRESVLMRTTSKTATLEFWMLHVITGGPEMHKFLFSILVDAPLYAPS